MGSGDDVLGIDEGATAGIDRFLGILLQNGHMPGIFTELTVTINIDGILDAASDARSVADTTTSQLLGRSLRTQWATAANLVDAAGLLYGTVAIVSALEEERREEKDEHIVQVMIILEKKP